VSRTDPGVPSRNWCGLIRGDNNRSVQQCDPTTARALTGLRFRSTQRLSRQLGWLMAQWETVSRHLCTEVLPACCCIQTPPRCNAVHSVHTLASAPSLSGVKLETTPSGKPNCRAGPLLSAPATLMCIPMPDRVIEFQRPVRTLEDLLNSIQEPEPDPSKL